MGGPARVSCIWGKCLEEKGYKVELLSDYHEQNSISYKFKQNHILEKPQKLNIINLSFSLFKILKSKNEEILVFNKGNRTHTFMDLSHKYKISESQAQNIVYKYRKKSRASENISY